MWKVTSLFFFLVILPLGILARRVHKSEILFQGIHTYIAWKKLMQRSSYRTYKELRGLYTSHQVRGPEKSTINKIKCQAPTCTRMQFIAQSDLDVLVATKVHNFTIRLTLNE